MTSFVALYRGETVGSAKLVALSADPVIVADVARQLLNTPEKNEEAAADTVLQLIQGGREQALRAIATGSTHNATPHTTEVDD